MSPVQSSHPIDSRRGYLDTPSMGLPIPETLAAMQAALQEWGSGRADHVVWERSSQACRRSFARLSGVQPERVGLLPSIVPAVSAAATVIARESGTVVVHRREFRSLLLPVLAQVEQDRLRWVDGPYVAETFTAAVDEGTSAVVVSAVSSHDGGRPSLTRLQAACDAMDAHLVVDGTQAAGLVVPDVAIESLLLFACAGYKGLRGPRGAAYAVGDDQLAHALLAPSAYGMADAGERGSYGPPLLPRRGGQGLDQSPVWLAWVGAEPALEHLLTGSAARRQAHVLALAAQLRDELESCGLTPQLTDLPSPVVTFEHEQADALVDRLAAHGLRCATRLGRVRLGFHEHNDEDDVVAVGRILRDRPH
ncbi:aminotransferase class V-fold PLP-dependent enzyme [Aeromicrobium sp. CTD01-1L150]|uniref:aminotransferase class V-fold PLP-dependent enzyme n=1 Tax=Aeromicrobium sp. CTD01-1L150 TaxID=3341830 RepID=UPI0035BF7FBE